MSTPTPARDPRWEALAAPFPADWIEKLPKPLSRQDQRKGRCKAGTDEARFVSADGHYCGGWHSRSVHLDYVGHAGITMRLNDAVGPENWSWEPLVVDERGMPVAERGEFWIKLTVLGVTKFGVGDDFNGSMKQAIGDALRNAAMRFGVGTYLWSKADMAQHLAEEHEEPKAKTTNTPAAPPPPSQAVDGYLAERAQPAAQQQPATVSTAGPAQMAQELAEQARRVRVIKSLKAIHDTAEANGLLGIEIDVPGQPRFRLPLGAFIMRRKEDIEQEPAA